MGQKRFRARLAACRACPECIGGRCRPAGRDAEALALLGEARCPLGRWPRERPAGTGRPQRETPGDVLAAAPADNHIRVTDEALPAEFLVKSFRRFNRLWQCVHSIKHWWPRAVIRIADDSLRPGESYPPIVETIRARPGVHWYEMPFDSGLPAGRNLLARKCEAEFLLNVDDDFVFTAESRPELLVRLVRRDLCDVACGLTRVQGRALQWGGLFDRRGLRFSFSQPSGGWEHAEGVRYRRLDAGFNYFATRAETVRRCPWDERLKVIFEHLDHFLSYASSGVRVAETPDSIVTHDKGGYAPDEQGYRSREGNERRRMLRLLLHKWGLPGLPNHNCRPAPVADVPQAELLAPLKDRTNVVILTVGRSGSSIVAKLLHRLGWCAGDADEEFGESVTMRAVDNRTIYDGRPFDASEARRLLEGLPEPWCLKHPGMLHTWRSWLPLLAPYRPTLLWLTRSPEAVARSLIRQRQNRGRKAVARIAGGLTVEEGLRRCDHCYRAWPWEKLQLDVEHLAATLSLFDPERLR